MRTNIIIDDVLMDEVMRAFAAKTKREAVDLALCEALQLRRQEALMGLWRLGWEGDLEEMRTDKHLPGFG